MQFSITCLITLTALFTSAAVDWYLWSGSCSIGFGDSNWTLNSVSTYDQGGCDGCTLGSLDLDNEFDSGNPCDCDQSSTYIPTDDGLDVYISGEHDLIAQCTGTDSQNGGVPGRRIRAQAPTISNASQRFATEGEGDSASCPCFLFSSREVICCFRGYAHANLG